MPSPISLSLVLSCLLTANDNSVSSRGNLCVRFDCEASRPDGGPAGWTAIGSGCSWSSDQRHSGSRSLRVASTTPTRSGWRSGPIAVSQPGRRVVLSLWAKWSNIAEGQGVVAVLEYLDAQGKKSGRNTDCTLGGSTDVASETSWRQYFVIGDL